ncbi:unnamed protein product [Oppiella nova]|uniref:SWIM-type domain-containing protein n=1 Tax=Oppiella nova TaxID=334625 RepID=A0A7R9L9I9_9ACAR|nr:unnamed protein product [Oppiella nova]CAG2160856.1 unnamed protein product [Oppiella nova]
MSSKIIHQLFDALVNKIVQNNNQMSDEVIESVDLISSNKVSKLITNHSTTSCVSSTPDSIPDSLESLDLCQSHRVIFEVESNDKKSKTTPNRYFCLIDANYCSCDAFRKGVMNDTILWCKHLLASKLSNAMKSYKTVVTSHEKMDNVWTNHILN